MSLLLWKTAFFIATEVCLTWIGVDDLADYSEFVFKSQASISPNSSSLAEYDCCQAAVGLVCRRQMMLPNLLWQ